LEDEDKFVMVIEDGIETLWEACEAESNSVLETLVHH
jgi:hypothetical protein